VVLPGLVTRVLTVVGVVVGGVFAAVGGLALRPPGLVAVGVAGVLAGLTAAAVARDAPGHTWRSTMETAALAVAGVVGALLVVSGTAVLVGGAGTVLLVATAAIGVLVRGWRRASAAQRGSHGPSDRRSATDAVPLAAVGDPGDGPPVPGRAEPWSDVVPDAATARLLPPVAGLSTTALGREWLRTTAALSGRLAPAARRRIVDRREATLDELERRDPAGFERWMAGGPAPGSDPAEYVRGGPAADTEAA
jgi:hypothetical protein